MRIAFLTLNAYDILTGSEEGDIGGAQVQQIHIARELASRGHQPIFIENDRPDKQPGVYDGIEVVVKPVRRRGHPVLRAPIRIFDVLRVLRRSNPDVCYARVLLFETIPTALYCAISDTRFVYGFAHDSEVTDNPVVLDSTYSDNQVYRSLLDIALDSADLLIAQNAYQSRRAVERLDTPVRLIPNGYPRIEGENDPFVNIDRPVVLWVSTLRSWKQPELVLEIADDIPEAMFVIIGPSAPENPELAEEIRQEASKRPNVRFEGFVPYSDIDDYFSSADLFLNTSTNEGFPNTFLQAWSQGVPVASLDVNPSGILTDHDVGFYSEGSIDGLIEFVSETVTNGARLERLSECSRSYFDKEHSIERIADAYESAFKD